MPMPQAFAQVDAVFDRRRELFDAGEIRTEERFGLLADVASKTLDAIILGGPGTLTEGIPLERPSATFHASRLRSKRKGSPVQGRPLETIVCLHHVAIREFQLPDTSRHCRL